MRNWPLMNEERTDGTAGGGTGAGGTGAGTAAAAGTGGSGAGTAAATGAGPTGSAAAGTTAATTSGAAAAGAAASKSIWPDNWLEIASEGDDKRAKILGRYASPKDVANAYLSLKRRQDSGELRASLPKDAKPEELAAWRKDNGIPAKPEDYDLKDLKIPESDKEIVSGFVKTLHAQNAGPEIVKAAVKSYYDELGRQEHARLETDEKQRVQTIDALGAEWGGKFGSYRTRVENILSIFPDSVREAMKSARLPDGTAIFNNPDVMRGFLAISLRDIPEGVTVPAGDGNLGKSLTDRYTEIQKVMQTNRKAYNRDSGMQKEHRELIDAMQKHGLIDRNGNLTEKKAA